MRTHLTHPSGGLACGRASHYQNSANLVDVDCKSCQRTKVYKKLFAAMPAGKPVVVVPAPAPAPLKRLPVFLRPIELKGVNALHDEKRREIVRKHTVRETPEDYYLRQSLPRFQRVSLFEYRSW